MEPGHAAHKRRLPLPGHPPAGRIQEHFPSEMLSSVTPVENTAGILPRLPAFGKQPEKTGKSVADNLPTRKYIQGHFRFPFSEARLSPDTSHHTFAGARHLCPDPQRRSRCRDGSGPVSIRLCPGMEQHGKLFLIQNGNAQGTGFLKFGAGVLSHHQIVKTL